jgi:membrane protease YdiL (CAAX protease family)
MKLITHWVRRYPIVAFYIITFAITWGLGYSYIGVLKHHIDLLAFLGSIATCGPALAGMIITSIENQAPRTGSKKSRWIAFLIAFLISSAVFNASNFLVAGVPFSWITLVGASLLIVPPVAYVISGSFSRVLTVRSYLRTLVTLRGVIAWSLIALVFTPSLILLSFPILRLLGRPAYFGVRFAASGFPLLGLIALKFLYQLLFFNATGEEAGWSGFARHRLQTHMSPLLTALIVTLFWAPWHAFLWYAEGQDVLTFNYWIGTFFDLIPSSILLTWLYNRSKGSILVAGIGHAAANTIFDIIVGIDMIMVHVIIYIAVIALIVIDKMWRKLPTEHPAVYSPSSKGA